jgi:hypothetical protein
MVAPHPSDCGGLQEPGFTFETSRGFDGPYLAHDLDVYTPASSLADVPSPSLVGALGYGERMIDRALERDDVPEIDPPPLPRGPTS